MSKANKIIATLNHKLIKLDNEKLDRDLITKESYFSRKPKKISFIDDMKLILAMGSGSIKKEMYKYFNYDIETISSSGFVQSRAKIKDKTFKDLMDLLNKAYPCDKTYKGYRLLACDGSEISICYDANDYYYKSETGSKGKGVSKCVVTCLYDILNSRYLDAFIQSIRSIDEREAFLEMEKRCSVNKAIFIADRGYESFNLFEHLKFDNKLFLFRIRDLDSGINIIKGFNGIPKTKEFDVDVSCTFSKKQHAKYKKDKKYRFISSTQRFDFLSDSVQYYDASYRIVRIRSNSKQSMYESFATNLPRDKFSTEDIKELYRLRWCIETSFRHLKYSVGLNALHSKRRDFIKQEILARLVMYNISTIIINEIKIKKQNKKYDYKVNVTLAIFLIKEFCINKQNKHPPDLIKMIKVNILPVRNNRNFKRVVVPQGWAPFNYRF